MGIRTYTQKNSPEKSGKIEPPAEYSMARGGYITFFGAALPIYAAKSVIIFLLDLFHVVMKKKEVYYKPVR